VLDTFYTTVAALELEGLFVSGLLLTGVALAAAIFVSTGPHLTGRDEP
jgi:hypothetical protein